MSSREPSNPYRPPDAALAEAAPPRGSPAKAVAYGVLIDVGGSLLAGVVLVLAYTLVLAASGVPIEEIQRRLEPSPTSWLSILGFAVGFAASFLGGYVCARIVRAAEMKWVGMVAAASAVSSLLLGPDDFALEWTALFALVGMSAVFAGGWTGAKRNRGRA